ncbi:MAG: hypothetical protein JWO44_663 [Bacteroidetes bacterium]|nr:hypothetical protein [Bacteroidota bacterium]
MEKGGKPLDVVFISGFYYYASNILPCTLRGHPIPGNLFLLLPCECFDNQRHRLLIQQFCLKIPFSLF